MVNTLMTGFFLSKIILSGKTFMSSSNITVSQNPYFNTNYKVHNLPILYNTESDKHSNLIWLYAIGPFLS